MESNPYAPPQADIRTAPQATDADQVRAEHLKEEANLKAVGILYYLGALAVVPIGIGIAMNPNPAEDSPAALGYLLIVLGLIQGFTAYGLRRLRPWARLPTIILSCIGLLGFPIGTLINGYILYCVFSRKGRVVLSPPYQEVIAATPHLKYKTSKVAIVLLFIIIIIVLFGVISLLISTKS